MRRFRSLQGLTIGLILLVLLWIVGCARPAELPRGDSTAQTDQHPVPFHEAGTSTDESHQPGSPAVQGSGPKSEAGLPFRDPQNLPAGTLLTVRLRNSITAEYPGAHGTFEAILDEPVVIEGNKLVPRGTTMRGRVESAHASNLKRNDGYVRLVLDSMHVAGLNLPVRTSSLFVRGNAGEAEIPKIDGPDQEFPTVIRLEKGRRLTFRLTETVYVAASQHTAADQ